MSPESHFMKNPDTNRLEQLLSAEFLCPGTYVVEADAPFTDGRLSSGLFSTHYDIGIDARIRLNEKPSHHICSKGKKPAGMALKILSTSAAPHLNKQLEMTGHVKSNAVKGWLGLFMRVDGPENRMLNFQAACSSPATGTTGWEKYQILIKVPWNSTQVHYGILLSGSGRIWANGFAFHSL